PGPLTPQLEGHGCPVRDRDAGADDRVRPDVALAEVDEVHRSADALGSADRAAHELAERDDRLHPKRERLAMAAICVRLDIARPHGRDGSDRDGFLPLTEVRGPLDLAGQEELLDLLLER